jgi:hypothetical protein
VRPAITARLAAVTLLAWGAACASGQGESGVGGTFGGLPLGAEARPDASPPAPPAWGGRCPEDAPWNGKVCLGHGYVACPGESRMDDAGACGFAAADAGADAALR